MITTIINLLLVKILIDILGVNMYGVYSVIIGFSILVFSLAQSLNVSCQRYFSYYSSKEQIKKLVIYFNFSLRASILMGLFLLIAGFICGYFYLTNFASLNGSNPLEIFSCLIFLLLFSFFQLVCIPMNALIISKEHFNFYSIIGLTDSILKILSATIVLYSTFSRPLLFYSFLLFISGLIMLLIRLRYLKINFNFLSFNLFDFSFYQDFFSFSAISSIGLFSGNLNNHGNNVLINIFFDPVINTYRSVSFQLSNLFTQLSNTLFLAFKPRIIHLYSKNKIEEMMNLVLYSSKAIFYFLIIIIYPLFDHIDFFLELWIGQNEPLLILFCKLALIFCLILSIHNPITAVIHATEKILKFSLVTEGIIMLAFPLTLLFFYLGFDPLFTFYISIVVTLFAQIARIIICRELINVSFKPYLKFFVKKSVLVLFCLVLFDCIFNKVFNIDELNIFLTILIKFFMCTFIVLLIGVNHFERKLIHQHLNSYFNA